MSIFKISSLCFALTLSLSMVSAFASTSAERAKADSQSYSATNDDPRPKIRLGFTAVSTLHRQLLLTIDENATAGIDWGYDGEYFETEWEDMYWLLEGQKFIIQGTDEVNETSILPIGYHIHNAGVSTIMIDELENFYDDLNIYIYDKELSIYHSLRHSNYSFYSEAGEHLNRFELVFSIPETLSNPSETQDTFDFYYSNSDDSIVLKNPSAVQINKVSLLNMSGQIVFDIQTNNTFGEKRFKVPHLSSGTYIIMLRTVNGMTSKKVLIN